MKNEKKSMSTEINLIPLFKALLRKLWLIILVGALFASAAYGTTKTLIKPTYSAGFTAYVNNQHYQSSKDTLTSSDVNASKDLVRTYKSILKSSAILSASAKSINLDYVYTKLKGMVQTEVQGDTEIISVYVVSESPQIAYDLACAIAKVAPQTMSEIVEGSSMKIIDYPYYSENRYGPSYFRYAVLGFLAGALIILIKVIIDFFKDDKIKSEQDIDERFEYPILGVIPDIAVLDTKNAGYRDNAYAYRQQNNSGRSKMRHEE